TRHRSHPFINYGLPALRLLLRQSCSAWLCAGILLLVPSLARAQVTWTFAGPSGVSDRVIGLAADPRNPSTIYAAAGGAGVWKTQDTGATWAPVFDSQPSLQVCSVAIDPIFTDIVYAGTGDVQSPEPHQGVARSTDGG